MIDGEMWRGVWNLVEGTFGENRLGEARLEGGLAVYDMMIRC